MIFGRSDSYVIISDTAMKYNVQRLVLSQHCGKEHGNVILKAIQMESLTQCILEEVSSDICNMPERDLRIHYGSRADFTQQVIFNTRKLKYHQMKYTKTVKMN